MNSINNRKGITPVIAIVLLLMVTVGAVGVVYTQFQSLVGDPTGQIDDQQQDQNTDFSVVRGVTNVSSIDTSGSHSVDNYGILVLELQNTGSVARNTSDLDMFTTTGQVPGRDGALCTSPENATVINPDETIKCHTGIIYPQATNPVEVVIDLAGVEGKDWTHECNPRRSGQTFCM